MGSRKELHEASCLLPIPGSTSLAFCCSLTAVSSHPIMGMTCLFVPFQRSQDQLSGDLSAEMGVSALWGFFSKLLSFTMASLFALFPRPREAAGSRGCLTWAVPGAFSGELVFVDYFTPCPVRLRPSSAETDMLPVLFFCELQSDSLVFTR